MPALIWGVRRSLLRYVMSVARGEIVATGGAEMTDEGIVFPAADRPEHPFAFRGAVTMTGHGGALRIALCDPVLHHEADGRWLLSATDDKGVRAPIADIDCFVDDGSGVVWAGTTTLTSDGVPRFGGQYPAGSLLDSPAIRLQG